MIYFTRRTNIYIYIIIENCSNWNDDEVLGYNNKLKKNKDIK